MIRIRQIPPISLGGNDDSVLFGALTDGPSLVTFPVAREGAEVIGAQLQATLAGGKLNRGALQPAAKDRLLDAHSFVYLSRPDAFVVNLEQGRVEPYASVDGELVPVSTTLMALVAAVWDVPLLCDESELKAVAVPIPQGADARDWSWAAFNETFASMIATRFQGIEFSTELSPELLARFSP